MSTQSENDTDRSVKSNSPIEVWMLLIIMATLVLVFFIGLSTMRGKFAAGVTATDMVAIFSPVITAIGAVAAGVFGYSLGSRGATEAQQTATQVSQEAATVRKEAAASAAAAASLARNVRRIAGQAKAGEESMPGKRHLSVDDLETIDHAAGELLSGPPR